MRPRTILVLVAAVGVVTVICELESIAAANRWDPADIGRSGQLSLYLWPNEADNLREGEYALITVRVETANHVRTYRYHVVPTPCEDPYGDILERMDDAAEDGEIEPIADELDADPAAAGL